MLQGADEMNREDLQRTKFFLSQYGVQAILNIRVLVLRRKNLIYRNFIEIQAVLRD